MSRGELDTDLTIKGAWTFSGNQTFDGTAEFNSTAQFDAAVTFNSDILITANNALVIENASPEYHMREDDATADEGNWIFRIAGDVLKWGFATDAAPTNNALSWLEVSRTGVTLPVKNMFGDWILKNADDDVQIDFNVDNAAADRAIITLKGGLNHLNYFETGQSADEGGWMLLNNNNDVGLWSTADATPNSAAVNAWLAVRGTGTAISSLQVNTNLEVRSGLSLIINNGNNTEQLTLLHNGSYAKLESEDDGGIQLKNPTDGIFHLFEERTAIADDATETWTIPTGVGHAIWIVKNSWDDSADGMFANTGTSTTKWAGGFNFQLGNNGTNPDVDGDVNCYMQSSTVMAMKNRTGGSRSFFVIVIGL